MFSFVPSAPTFKALGFRIIGFIPPLLNGLLELEGLVDDSGVGLYLYLFGTWRLGWCCDHGFFFCHGSTACISAMLVFLVGRA